MYLSAANGKLPNAVPCCNYDSVPVSLKDYLGYKPQITQMITDNSDCTD